MKPFLAVLALILLVGASLGSAYVAVAGFLLAFWIFTIPLSVIMILLGVLGLQLSSIAAGIVWAWGFPEHAVAYTTP